MGWVGNVFLILGLVLAGRKWKHAYAWTVAGEVLWLIESAKLVRWDMIVLCAVFAVIAAWNWWQWVRGEQ